MNLNFCLEISLESILMNKYGVFFRRYSISQVAREFLQCRQRRWRWRREEEKKYTKKRKQHFHSTNVHGSNLMNQYPKLFGFGSKCEEALVFTSIRILIYKRQKTNRWNGRTMVETNMHQRWGWQDGTDTRTIPKMRLRKQNCEAVKNIWKS